MGDHLGLVIQVRDQEYLLFGDQAGAFVAYETSLDDLLLGDLIEVDLHTAILTILN